MVQGRRGVLGYKVRKSAVLMITLNCFHEHHPLFMLKIACKNDTCILVILVFNGIDEEIWRDFCSKLRNGGRTAATSSPPSSSS